MRFNLLYSRPRTESSRSTLPFIRRGALSAAALKVAIAIWVCLSLLGVEAVGVAHAADPSAPGESPPDLPVPDRFIPGSINRSPSGSPLPTKVKDARALGPLKGRRPGDEVLERRTETTKTFTTDEGHFETRFYQAPINYKDSGGKWQTIDNSLVPSSEPGYALRNAENRTVISFPGDLAHKPVRVAADGHFVEFRPVGAAASPKANKQKATYANAMPGVDIVYSVMNQGLKEDLILSGPTAPSSYDFEVAVDQGLTAKETDKGGISFTDSSGATWAEFAPPFVHDASYPEAKTESNFSTQAVSLKISATAPQLVVRLSVDPIWLLDPQRVWPVTIDPQVIFRPRNDTFISSGLPNTNFSASAAMGVMGGSSVRRSLFFSTTDLPNFFKEPVDVLAAAVDLYTSTDTTGVVAPQVSAHALTSDWGTTEATWNQRRTGASWATPGADFNPVADSAINVTGPPGPKRWFITSMVRSWIEDAKPNHGVLFKYENESGGPWIPFHSSEGDLSAVPLFRIQWEPLQGLRSPYKFEGLDLGERRQALVNVANGNLFLREQDLNITGTGLDGTVDRTFVSRGPYIASVGARWRMWPQSEERLGIVENGDAMVHSGSTIFLQFRKKPDGTFLAPSGYRGSLIRESDGSFTLTEHETGTKYGYFSTGYPRDVADKNGNKLSFGYQYDPSTGENYIVSMTDTQGRVTTFERAGEHQVSKITDPAGRIHRYSYTPDQFGNPLLVKYVDPAGKETLYEYSNDNYLSKITDPNGNSTTFGYIHLQRGFVKLRFI